MVNLPSAGTMLVWSRIKAPDNTNNSYFLQIDSGCPIVVGDSDVTAGAWTWVNFQDGNLASKISLDLAAGQHTLTLTGREPGVAIDRLVFSLDPSCLPADNGDNCAVAATNTAVPTAAPVDPTPVPATPIPGTPIPGSTATPTPVSSGDYNNDGRVDMADLSTMINGWIGAPGPLDLNADSVLDVYDLSILLSHWSN
jgi:hypothetical protein